LEYISNLSDKNYNITKGLRNTSFNGNLFMKFFAYKETSIMNNLFHENFQFFLKMIFILNDKYMFGSTLCYDNVDDNDFLKL
jgi:hypothetical protein